jgi:hypothetical protein
MGQIITGLALSNLFFLSRIFMVSGEAAEDNKGLARSTTQERCCINLQHMQNNKKTLIQGPKKKINIVIYYLYLHIMFTNIQLYV